MSDLMSGLYMRVGMNNARITPNEMLLLIRDYDKRLKVLEEENARLEKVACDRSGTCGLSDDDVPSS